MVQLVDGKRAQNAGIALARLRMSPEDIAKAVLEMDEEKLPADKVQVGACSFPSLLPRGPVPTPAQLSLLYP